MILTSTIIVVVTVILLILRLKTYCGHSVEDYRVKMS